MLVRKYWSSLCRRREVPPGNVAALEKLAEEWGEHCVAWAIVQYGKETAVPRVKDFLDWLEGVDLPDELVCAAYLTEDPTVVALADRLETLRGAWFPDESVEREIEELHTLLGNLLR